MTHWILTSLAVYWLIGVALMSIGLWDNGSIRRMAQGTCLFFGVALCWPLLVGETVRWTLKRNNRKELK